MTITVARGSDGHRLVGDETIVESANCYLVHLGARGFSPATVRAYAFDLSNFARFLADRELDFDEVRPSDLFDYIDWQARSVGTRRAGNVIPIGSGRGPAPATMNRRIAAVRGFFEYCVSAELLADNPVPAARRSSGLRAPRRGLLGHLGTGRPRTGGQLVKEPRRLPESLDPSDVTTFFSDLETHRDRAIVLAMVLGGLRSAEVRSLKLADIDMGLSRLKVLGKGRRERVVPVDPAFFSECAAYVRTERPRGSATPECFVLLRGPTTGHALSEAGLRKIFRTHRSRSGRARVRPHRLRHTYGTELAAAGIDLLALRDLMGHASPETTAAYVHLSPEVLARQYGEARRTSER